MADLDHVKLRLIEAAGPIFAEGGYRAANVREICERAGVKNIGAVNYYFGSKEQLYIEACRHAYQSCAASVPLPTWPAGVPAEQRLGDFVRMMLSRLLSPDTPEWHRLLMMREVGQPTEACREFVRDFVRPSFGLLLSVIDDLMPADTPPEKRRLIAGSVVGQCLHYHHNRHVIRMLVGEVEYRGLDVAVLADHITHFTLAALGRGGEATR